MQGAKLHRKPGFPFGNPPLEIGFPQRFQDFRKFTTNTLSNGYHFKSTAFTLCTNYEGSYVKINMGAFQRYTTCLCPYHFLRVSSRKSWSKFWVSSTIFWVSRKSGNPVISLPEQMVHLIKWLKKNNIIMSRCAREVFPYIGLTKGYFEERKK